MGDPTLFAPLTLSLVRVPTVSPKDIRSAGVPTNSFVFLKANRTNPIHARQARLVPSL
ncbi:hypothetical protein HGB47_00910 [Leptospira yasudae]|uniref:hypothetical protein n=1 Tax=Leptospira yasudae TaxID=2202201 RepID=UPI001C4EFE37|nr:hypothetical protein [Leptospira yasudae]MBW0432171.1 hypothetical protein [Leptospira yasudae]